MGLFPLKTAVEESVAPAGRGTVTVGVPANAAHDSLGGGNPPAILTRFFAFHVLMLPLAANDASGQWTVTVTELLSSKSGSKSFEFKAPRTLSAMAGAVVALVVASLAAVFAVAVVAASLVCAFASLIAEARARPVVPASPPAEASAVKSS